MHTCITLCNYTHACTGFLLCVCACMHFHVTCAWTLVACDYKMRFHAENNHYFSISKRIRCLLKRKT